VTRHRPGVTRPLLPRAGPLAGRLIATDIDGTLLRSDHTLAGRTIEALDAARHAGAVLALATGRDWHAITDLLNDLPSIDYALCVNGIEVFRADGHELLTFTLEAATAVRIVRTLRQNVPGVAIGAGLGGRLIGEPAITAVMPTDVGVVEEVDDIISVLFDAGRQGPDIRDLIVHHPQHASDVDAWFDRVSRSLGSHDGFELAHTGMPQMVEIVPPRAGKHTGLAWLADHLDIHRHNVVAVGDGLNDLAMLAWAGTGVAMGQAHPRVKAAADEVALTNDEDGLAAYLHTLH